MKSRRRLGVGIRSRLWVVIIVAALDYEFTSAWN